jgi:hypothetical protein
MLYRLVAGGFALALLVASGPAPAQDKKDKALGPVWEREDSGVTLKFELGKDTAKMTVALGENGFVANCKSTTDKDGVVKLTVIEATEKGNFPRTPKKGYELSFKWKAGDNTATLSDLKGEGLDDVKTIIEGEYKKVKK